MGLSYSAGVFFGTCVMRRSPLGELLDEYIDKAGGTPAETEVPGVVVCMVGDEGGWLTVQARGSARRYGRNEGDCPEPALLVEDPAWRPAIERFMAIHRAPWPPVGWHFQGSVF